MSSAGQRGAVLLAMTLAAAMAFASPSNAQQGPQEEVGFADSREVLMQADELTYDRETRVVTATGHVELAYG
ncbi:MAG: hypothetical protein RH951_14375, partial [Parvibaculum sp.]